jgi:puromycin-sensitive aminopeptidase
MDSWIFQPGLPEIAAARDGDTITLRQRRFRYAQNGNGDQHWSIPMIVRIGDRTETVLLDGSETTLTASPDDIVVVHGGGEGFYRVNYPAAWRTQLVESGACNALERFALVDDAWAQVLAGDVTAGEFLDLCRRFDGETDLVVWRGIVGRLHEASRLVDGTALDRFRTIVGDLVRPAFERLGWEPADGEDGRRRQLRGVLLETLGTLVRDDEVVARARDEHRDPEMAAAALAVVAASGADAEFDTYLAQVRDAPTPQEQLRYLYALPRFPSEHLVVRACELSLTDQVRTQNAPFVVQRALAHRDHGRRIWEFVRDNWDAIAARFPRTLMPRMYGGVTWLVDAASVAEIPAFVDSHPVPEGKQVIAQHLERQQVHAAVTARERGRFAASLEQTD